MTHEKLTLYSLGTATLEAVSVSAFPGAEVMKWESHQTCMHRTGKKRVKKSWPGGNTHITHITHITVCGLCRRAAVEAEMLT